MWVVGCLLLLSVCIATCLVTLLNICFLVELDLPGSAPVLEVMQQNVYVLNGICHEFDVGIVVGGFDVDFKRDGLLLAMRFYVWFQLDWV